jgi:hypothetical protein
MSGSPHAVGALPRLHELLEAEPGPLAEALAPRAEALAGREVFAPLLAKGTRTGSQAGAYALLVESILEGYLLHYGTSRILDPPSRDLRLVAGDYLYALGLARLAEIGDLEAVDELADLISLCAQAHAAASDDGSQGMPWRLTRGLWALSVLAVAYGRWSEQELAKSVARANGIAVADDLVETALARAQELDGGVELEHALIAFESAVEGRFST